MKRISDSSLMGQYTLEHKIGNIFDEDILKYAYLHFFEKDEFILKAEAQLEYYYLLVDGKVKISYLFENGKSMFLKFYSAFNTLGDLELLKNLPIKCNVEAVTDAWLIAIPSEILRKNCLDNIKFLRHLAESLGEKLYATINNSSYNYVYPLVNRLSSYLVEHIAEGSNISLNSSYGELAQFLGTTYRHLNRTIKELEAEGIIKCKKRQVQILDEERLRELSKNLFIKPL